MEQRKTVLSDRFALGEELGRGAYGQVFKGTDLATGEVVAIKQISLAGMSTDNLAGVMGEIELLKTLNHPNIVKYLGSFKTRTHLYIILEYMDDGAVSALIKPHRFGLLSEALASGFVRQVLQGLRYLHEQGVVHRDIKGANILTRKGGVVKLADFGVAAKLGELEERRDELQQHVVGTPYWMAPEVILMTQVTPAADIWSVGCLIVEMLTGAPPNYDLQPMSALFRIVQDDRPPLPDGITPLMQDFLLRCFQKDPRKRPGAQDLLHHDWLRATSGTVAGTWRSSGRGSLLGRARPGRDFETVASVVDRMVEATEVETGGGALPATPAEAPPGGAAVSPAVTIPRIPPPPADAALRASISSSAPWAATGVGPSSAPLRDGAVSASPAVSATSGPVAVHTPQATLLPPGLAPAASQPLAAGALGVEVQTPDTATAAVAWEQEQQQRQGAWEEEQRRQAAEMMAMQQQQQQQQQTAVAYAAQPALQQPVMAYAGPITSLVSMLGGAPQPTGGQLAPWLRDADQLTTVAGSGDRPSASGGYSPYAPSPGGGAADMTTAPGWGRVSDSGPMAYMQPLDGGADAAMLGATQPSSTLLELRKQVRELVRGMRPVVGGGVYGGPGSNPAAACQQLAALVMSSPDAKQLMMTETGALVLLELLDTDNPKYVEGAMGLLLAITDGDLVTLETICLLGVVPAAAKYALPPYPASLRLRTATFLSRFFHSGPSTLAHFVACQGLKQLVAMVADMPGPKQQAPPPPAPPYSPGPPYGSPTSAPAAPPPVAPPAEPGPGLALSQLAIDCIFQFLDCYNILPHNYLCRLLAQNGLVPRLYAVLKETITQLSKPSIGNSPSGGKPLGTAPAHSNGVASSVMTPMSGAGGNVRTAGSAYNALDSNRQQGLSTATSAKTPDARGGLAASLSASPGGGPDDGSGAKSGTAAGLHQEHLTLSRDELTALQEATVSLLLLLSNADAHVKAYCCTRDALQDHLECLGRLHPPSLVRLMRALRWLTGELSVIPVIKAAGAIDVLVPFLAPKDRSSGAAQLAGAQVTLEALHALSNICKFNKAHLEFAASKGVTVHLVRMAGEGLQALAAAGRNGRPTQAGAGGSPGGPGGGPPPEEELLDPVVRWGRLRGFVVPLMIALVSASSSTRAKLWAADGPSLFLALLSDQESVELGVPAALDTWLGDDHARMEPKLTSQAAVAQLVGLYARIAQARDQGLLPTLLTVLRSLIDQSSKLAVALALGPGGHGPGGIVPCLLAMIDTAGPILRVKILEIIRCLYEHYPRPKEFLLLHRIPDVLRRLLDSGGRGSDAVHQEAQRLLTAFQINVLF